MLSKKVTKKNVSIIKIIITVYLDMFNATSHLKYIHK